jgi:Leucine-rich repeat (LRR) protein
MFFSCYIAPFYSWRASIPGLRIAFCALMLFANIGQCQGAKPGPSESDNDPESEYVACLKLSKGHPKLFPNANKLLFQIRTTHRLNLENTVLTDADFETITRLSSIRLLELAGDIYLSDSHAVMLHRMPNLKELTVNSRRLSPVGIRALCGFHIESLAINTKCAHACLDAAIGIEGVRELLLNGCPLTAADIADLAAHPDLKRIYAIDCGIDDSALLRIPRLTKLKSLFLSLNMLKGTSLQVLFSRCQSLQELALCDNPIDANAISGIQDLGNLEYLDLSNTHVDDEDLRYVRPLTNLKLLKLNNCNISDDGVRLLTNLSALERIEIAYAKLTEVSVVELTKLPKLAQVYLQGNPGVTFRSLGSLETPRHWTGYPDIEQRQALIESTIEQIGSSTVKIPHILH